MIALPSKLFNALRITDFMREDIGRVYMLKTQLLNITLCIITLFFSSFSSAFYYIHTLTQLQEDLSRTLPSLHKQPRTTEDIIEHLKTLEDSLSDLKNTAYDIYKQPPSTDDLQKTKEAIINVCNEANQAIYRAHKAIQLAKRPGTKSSLKTANLSFKKAIISYTIAEPSLMAEMVRLEQPVTTKPYNRPRFPKKNESGPKVNLEYTTIMHAISVITLLTDPSGSSIPESDFEWLKTDSKYIYEPLLKFQFSDFKKAGTLPSSGSQDMQSHTNFDADDTYLFYLALNHFIAISHYYRDHSPRQSIVKTMNNLAVNAYQVLTSEITAKQAFSNCFKTSVKIWKTSAQKLGYRYDQERKQLVKISKKL